MSVAETKKKNRSARSKNIPCHPSAAISCSTEFLRSVEPSSGLEVTLHKIRKLLPRSFGEKEECLIHLWNKKHNLLELAGFHRAETPWTESFKPGEGIPGSAFLRKKPVLSTQRRKEASGSWKEAARAKGIHSILSLPLRGRKSVLGTLTFLSRNPRPAWNSAMPQLLSLTDQAALAIEDTLSYQKVWAQLKKASRDKEREGELKKFLENIVDRSADPIMATDLRGKLSFVSRGAEEMFGLPKDELLGRKISEFYAGGEREARKIMKTLARKDKLRNYETEFIGPGGKRIFIIMSASILRDARGNPTGTLGVSREITDYKNLLNHITRTEQSYQKLFEAVNDAIFFLNREGYFSTFNRMFLKMTGYTEKEIRSFHFSKIIHPEDIPMMVDDHQKVIRGDYAPERYTFRLINKEEKITYVEGNFRRLKEKTEVVGVLAVLRDVTEKIRLEKELLELSITDGLTGLHNQRHFYNELDKEMERAKRQHTTLSLLLFDLDDFKVFNDIHGHLEGDKVLRNVAQVVLKSIRRMDSAYRYGGDEFTVILPGATRVEATQVAERIRKTFETTPYLQQIKLSIGLVEFDLQYDLTNFVKYADEAMYTAKKMGGNQIFIRS